MATNLPTGPDMCEELHAEIKRLRDALVMYHQAWNGSSVEWKSAMNRASANAEYALAGKERGK